MPSTFTHPSMPMYTHDQAAYMRHMHEWHTHMVKYHEEKRIFHLEMVKHFHQMMGGRVKETLTLVKEEVKTG